jgi:hypothetical protein
MVKLCLRNFQSILNSSSTKRITFQEKDTEITVLYSNAVQSDIPLCKQHFTRTSYLHLHHTCPEVKKQIFQNMIYDMLWYDVIWYMIWYMIHLTVNGFTPGSSSTVHIYTQTIQRTTKTNNTYNIKIRKTAGRAPSLRVLPWYLPYNWG